jgi:hypothetical protein
MPPVSRQRRCTCPVCCSTNPQGRDVTDRTFRRHKANQHPIPTSSTAKFWCTYCPNKHPDGHQVSFSTIRRHKTKAGITSPDELQPRHFEDNPISPRSVGQLPPSQTPELCRTPPVPHLQESDDDNDSDETNSCGFRLDTGQTGSAEGETDEEAQGHEAEEEPCSILEAFLMENTDNESDSGSDIGTTSAEGMYIDADLDDLTFVRVARLRSKGLSREMYEEMCRIMRTAKIKLPCIRRAQTRLQRWTNIHPVLMDCCVNNCLAYTGVFGEALTCTHCNEPLNSSSGRSRNQFLYLPMVHRLALQYSDASRSRILKSYRQTYSEPSEDTDRRQLRDIFDGALYRDFHLQELGLFGDPHDIALHLSLDGVQVTNLKNHEV